MLSLTTWSNGCDHYRFEIQAVEKSGVEIRLIEIDENGKETTVHSHLTVSEDAHEIVTLLTPVAQKWIDGMGGENNVS